MSIFAPFIIEVKDKILAESIYVTDPLNVLLTNNVEIASLPDTAFPRVEIFVDTAHGDGYESQRDLNWNYRFWFTGYLKRTARQDNSSSLWTEADMLSIWDFGEKTMASVFGMLDQQQLTPTYPQFLMFNGNPVLTANCELIPYISTFMGFVEAKFQKGDTDG